MPIRGAGAILVFILVAGFFPVLAMVGPLFLVLRNLGILDSIWPLIIVYLVYTLPIATYLLRNFFMQIPPDLEEAALVDGATRLVALRRVVIPVAIPGVFTAGIIAFILAWNDFAFAVSFLETPSHFTAPLAIVNLGQSQFQVFYNRIDAAVVIITIPVALLVLLRPAPHRRGPDRRIVPLMAPLRFIDVSKVYPNGVEAVSHLISMSRTASSSSSSAPRAVARRPRCEWSPGSRTSPTATIEIGGRVVNDLSPRERDIAMVFQNYALYPHMTVAENIGFSLQHAEAAEGRGADEGGGCCPCARTHRPTAPQARAALRWAAPAGRDGPRDRARAGRVPDGRAAVEPRCQASRPHAGGGLAHPTPTRRRDAVCDARSGRGDDHGRSRRGHAVGAAAAVRGTEAVYTTGPRTCSSQRSSAHPR